MIVGKHRSVFEYDGAFKCLNCHAQWGALGLANSRDYPSIAPPSCRYAPDKVSEFTRCHCTHGLFRHIINGPCADCGCPAFQGKEIPLGCPECGHIDEPILSYHSKAIIEYNRAMEIYKEAMAAAWSKETNIPASEAEIVQQSMTQGGMRFYICKRKEGEVIAAAKNLHDKLSRIFGSPAYKGVFTMAFAHGYNYGGENVEEEMKVLGEALKK